jgi:hypothetical protein
MPIKNSEVDIRPCHDQVVLWALDCLQVIAARLRLDWTQQCHELEYPLAHPNGELYVDVAVFRGAPRQVSFLLEIKSASEHQSASSWTRQIRGYERLSGVPCVLVIAHDLGSVQSDYLREAGIRIVDLRTL